MSLDVTKPDLPLRLALHLFRIVLSSPIGDVMIRAGRKYINSDEKGWFETTRLCLKLPYLNPEFTGFRVVQISDFHIGTWTDRKKLDQVIGHVNLLQPDLVAMTGDFVTFTPDKYESDLVGALSSIRAEHGSIAVLGNHDHWADPKIVRRILDKSGVKELRNSILTLQRGKSRLHFAGVDDIMEDFDDLRSVLKQIPSDGAAILLAHEPDFADSSAASGRFDLQLSGHTHGGQVSFPHFGPLILPRYGRKYPSGYYQVDGMQLYTNRGIGTAELQFRYNCPAEITLIELFPGNQQDL